MGVKRKPNQRKHDPRRDHHSIPGQIEKRLEAAAEVWKRRCQGATYATISAEMGLSMGCIHNYIEETRALLREQNKDLAERERDQALALLDNAIERSSPTSMARSKSKHESSASVATVTVTTSATS